MLSLFEVIWLFDGTTSPPKRKMQVCLDYEQGWFLRINSGSHWRPCVPLSVTKHPFLKHDSYLECSLLSIDEYELSDALNRAPPIGRVDLSLKGEVLKHLLGAPYIRSADKDELRRILG